MIWEHWKEMLGVCGILGFLFGIYKWHRHLIEKEKDRHRKEIEGAKQEGKENGSITSQLCTHKKWLAGLEERTQVLEKAGFMTEKDHDIECEKCQKQFNLQISELKQIHKESEANREEQRKIQNRRMLSFENLVHDTREALVEVKTLVGTVMKKLQES